MLKKLLITIVTFALLSTLTLAQSYEVGYFDVNVDGFVNIDNTSTVEVNPTIEEVGIYVDVIVRVLDRNSNPLSGRTIQIYVVGNPASVDIIQPTQATDSDGYAIGKLRSSAQGSYTVKAFDTTFTQDIDIVDSATLTVFPIPSPSMLSEPYYTKGTSNRVYWDLNLGMSTYTYYVEVSKSANFSTIHKNSGWISTKSYEFENLAPGNLYYYRVKAKNIGGAQSGWSNTVFSTQDNKAPTINYVDIQRIYTKNTFTGISVIFDVSDDYEVDTVKFYCKLKNAQKIECGHIEKSGVRYYVNIPTSELEREDFGAFKEKYDFCVYAWDKAGNMSSNCDFSIDISKYVQTDFPVFTNLINSIYKIINENFKKIGNLFDFISINFHELGLQLLSILIYILVVLSSLAVIAQGIFVIPTYILYLILKFFSVFGYRKNDSVIGYVYDAISGKPVKYAKVTIYDGTNRRLFTTVTDKKGYFRGTLDTGKYRIHVHRSHYLFPSEMYKEYGLPTTGKLYLGEYIIVSKRNPMNVAIPLDPQNIYSAFEKNHNLEKKMIGLMKALTFLLLTIGLTISIVTLEKYSNILNLIFLLMYIPAFGIFLKSVIRLKLKQSK